MLVVSSHVDGTLATANFESVTVDSIEPMQSSDIGATAPSDSRIITPALAHTSVFSTLRTRAMIVPSPDHGVFVAGSKHAMAIVSAGKGISMQARTATAGTSAEVMRTPGAAPAWIRLTRQGNQISAFYAFEPGISPDGHIYTWEPLGGMTLSMNGNVFVGLAVTSHAPGALATAVFDDVMVIRP
jgi:hypothetical protein